MLNDLWQTVPMAQFFVIHTARGRYLMQHSEVFDPMWGYSKVVTRFI